MVQKAGEDRAAIVPMREYREMKRLKAEAKNRLFVLNDDLRASLADEDPQTVECMSSNLMGHKQLENKGDFFAAIGLPVPWAADTVCAAPIRSAV